jgi:hypothetical protein
LTSLNVTPWAMACSLAQGSFSSVSTRRAARQLYQAGALQVWQKSHCSCADDQSGSWRRALALGSCMVTSLHHMTRQYRPGSVTPCSQCRYETPGPDSLHQFGHAQQALELSIMIPKVHGSLLTGPPVSTPNTVLSALVLPTIFSFSAASAFAPGFAVHGLDTVSN